MVGVVSVKDCCSASLQISGAFPEQLVSHRRFIDFCRSPFSIVSILSFSSIITSFSSATSSPAPTSVCQVIGCVSWHCG